MAYNSEQYNNYHAGATGSASGAQSAPNSSGRTRNSFYSQDRISISRVDDLSGNILAQESKKNSLVGYLRKLKFWQKAEEAAEMKKESVKKEAVNHGEKKESLPEQVIKPLPPKAKKPKKVVKLNMRMRLRKSLESRGIKFASPGKKLRARLLGAGSVLSAKAFLQAKARLIKAVIGEVLVKTAEGTSFLVKRVEQFVFPVVVKVGEFYQTKIEAPLRECVQIVVVPLRQKVVAPLKKGVEKAREKIASVRRTSLEKLKQIQVETREGVRVAKAALLTFTQEVIMPAIAPYFQFWQKTTLKNELSLRQKLEVVRNKVKKGLSWLKGKADAAGKYLASKGKHLGRSFSKIVLSILQVFLTALKACLLMIAAFLFSLWKKFQPYLFRARNAAREKIVKALFRMRQPS